MKTAVALLPLLATAGLSASTTTTATFAGDAATTTLTMPTTVTGYRKARIIDATNAYALRASDRTEVVRMYRIAKGAYGWRIVKGTGGRIYKTYHRRTWKEVCPDGSRPYAAYTMVKISYRTPTSGYSYKVPACNVRPL